MSWVSAANRPNVAHRLHHISKSAIAIAECGSRWPRRFADFDPPRELPECRLCAEHVYARDNGKFCPHCHRRPAA